MEYLQQKILTKMRCVCEISGKKRKENIMAN